LFDYIERGEFFRGDVSGNTVFSRFAKVLDGKIDAGREGHAISEQIRYAGGGGMVVRIHQRKRKEGLSAFDIGKADQVGDNGNFARDSEWSDLSDIPELVYSLAAKKVFIDEIEQVVPAKRNRNHFPLLEIEGKQLRKVEGGDRAYCARTLGNNC